MLLHVRIGDFLHGHCTRPVAQSVADESISRIAHQACGVVNLRCRQRCLRWSELGRCSCITEEFDFVESAAKGFEKQRTRVTNAVARDELFSSLLGDARAHHQRRNGIVKIRLCFDSCVGRPSGREHGPVCRQNEIRAWTRFRRGAPIGCWFEELGVLARHVHLLAGDAAVTRALKSTVDRASAQRVRVTVQSITDFLESWHALHGDNARLVVEAVAFIECDHYFSVSL